MKAATINDMFATNGKIREDGHMVHDMYLVQVKAPADVKQPWDYYKVLRTVKGDEAFRSLSSIETKLESSCCNSGIVWRIRRRCASPKTTIPRE
jgi:branched-chain amino acid transport system substrate-binding protein